MNRNTLILFFCCFVSLTSFSQTDIYPGTWQMQFSPKPGNSNINIELQIASPARGVLYPAQVTLRCDSFKADYQLLLVKKK